jgi:hypothetical protein
MPLLNFRIELTLEGPVITRSSTAVTPGVDAPWLRDALGRHVLPGTLVAGRFADAIVDLVDIGVVDGNAARRYLGHEILHGKRPGRNRLVFDTGFYLANPEPPAIGLRRRIRIDPATGAAARGMLQVLEAPFASGELATFSGHVRVLTPEGGPDERPAIRDLLDRGLRWAPSFGASRTIGFGRNRGVRVEALEPMSPPATAALPLDEHCRAGLVLKPEQPFCLARPRRAHNLFEAETVVSGAVVKGTLARMLDDLYPGAWGGSPPGSAPRELIEHFSCIRILHAFPVEAGAGTRPAQPPASLVQDSDDKVWDVARAPGSAGLIRGAAPAFAIDWKKRGAVDADHGWAEPLREVRVRTAIDRASGRAADEKLFALELVWPVESGDAGDAPVEWVSGIDLSDVPAEGRVRDAVASQLAAVLRIGLCGVGKTKARFTASPGPWLSTRGSPSTSQTPQWVVSLQSPALFFHPADLPKDAGEDDLSHVYQRYWSEASTSKESGTAALRCVRYFASQHLAGGTVHASRVAAGKYRPWVLTAAGAVFVLEPTSGQEKRAQQLVGSWQRSGLPLPATVRKACSLGDSDGDHAAWQRCPFVRQNGFGEIVVNHHLHDAPQKWVAIEAAR